MKDKFKLRLVRDKDIKGKPTGNSVKGKDCKKLLEQKDVTVTFVETSDGVYFCAYKNEEKKIEKEEKKKKGEFTWFGPYKKSELSVMTQITDKEITLNVVASEVESFIDEKGGDVPEFVENENLISKIVNSLSPKKTQNNQDNNKVGKNKTTNTSKDMSGRIKSFEFELTEQNNFPTSPHNKLLSRSYSSFNMENVNPEDKQQTKLKGSITDIRSKILFLLKKADTAKNSGVYLDEKKYDSLNLNTKALMKLCSDHKKQYKDGPENFQNFYEGAYEDTNKKEFIPLVPELYLNAANYYDTLHFISDDKSSTEETPKGNVVADIDCEKLFRSGETVFVRRGKKVFFCAYPADTSTNETNKPSTVLTWFEFDEKRQKQHETLDDLIKQNFSENTTSINTIISSKKITTDLPKNNSSSIKNQKTTETDELDNILDNLKKKKRPISLQTDFFTKEGLFTPRDILDKSNLSSLARLISDKEGINHVKNTKKKQTVYLSEEEQNKLKEKLESAYKECATGLEEIKNEIGLEVQIGKIYEDKTQKKLSTKEVRDFSLLRGDLTTEEFTEIFQKYLHSKKVKKTPDESLNKNEKNEKIENKEDYDAEKLATRFNEIYNQFLNSKNEKIKKAFVNGTKFFNAFLSKEEGEGKDEFKVNEENLKKFLEGNKEFGSDEIEFFLYMSKEEAKKEIENEEKKNVITLKKLFTNEEKNLKTPGEINMKEQNNDKNNSSTQEKKTIEINVTNPKVQKKITGFTNDMLDIPNLNTSGNTGGTNKNNPQTGGGTGGSGGENNSGNNNNSNNQPNNNNLNNNQSNSGGSGGSSSEEKKISSDPSKKEEKTSDNTKYKLIFNMQKTKNIYQTPNEEFNKIQKNIEELFKKLNEVNQQAPKSNEEGNKKINELGDVINKINLLFEELKKRQEKGDVKNEGNEKGLNQLSEKILKITELLNNLQNKQENKDNLNDEKFKEIQLNINSEIKLLGEDFKKILENQNKFILDLNKKQEEMEKKQKEQEEQDKIDKEKKNKEDEEKKQQQQKKDEEINKNFSNITLSLENLSKKIDEELEKNKLESKDNKKELKDLKNESNEKFIEIQLNIKNLLEKLNKLGKKSSENEENINELNEYFNDITEILEELIDAGKKNNKKFVLLQKNITDLFKQNKELIKNLNKERDQREQQNKDVGKKLGNIIDGGIILNSNVKKLGDKFEKSINELGNKFERESKERDKKEDDRQRKLDEEKRKKVIVTYYPHGTQPPPRMGGLFKLSVEKETKGLIENNYVVFEEVGGGGGKVDHTNWLEAVNKAIKEYNKAIDLYNKINGTHIPRLDETPEVTTDANNNTTVFIKNAGPAELDAIAKAVVNSEDLAKDYLFKKTDDTKRIKDFDDNLKETSKALERKNKHEESKEDKEMKEMIWEKEHKKLSDHVLSEREESKKQFKSYIKESTNQNKHIKIFDLAGKVDNNFFNSVDELNRKVIWSNANLTNNKQQQLLVDLINSIVDKISPTVATNKGNIHYVATQQDSICLSQLQTLLSQLHNLIDINKNNALRYSSKMLFTNKQLKLNDELLQSDPQLQNTNPRLYRFLKEQKNKLSDFLNKFKKIKESEETDKFLKKKEELDREKNLFDGKIKTELEDFNYPPPTPEEIMDCDVESYNKNIADSRPDIAPINEQCLKNLFSFLRIKLKKINTLKDEIETFSQENPLFSNAGTNLAKNYIEESDKMYSNLKIQVVDFRTGVTPTTREEVFNNGLQDAMRRDLKSGVPTLLKIRKIPPQNSQPNAPAEYDYYLFTYSKQDGGPFLKKIKDPQQIKALKDSEVFEKHGIDNPNSIQLTSNGKLPLDPKVHLLDPGYDKKNEYKILYTQYNSAKMEPENKLPLFNLLNTIHEMPKKKFSLFNIFKKNKKNNNDNILSNSLGIK